MSNLKQKGKPLPDALILFDGVCILCSASVRFVIRRDPNVFIIIPRPLRDYLYDFVGQRRYRWFGKTETCWLPGPELKHRFFL